MNLFSTTSVNGSQESRDKAHLTTSNWVTLRNPNVRRTLIFCFIDGACYSLWSSQVYQVLVKRLSGDTTVGWLSASSGVSQMIAAVLVGFAPNLLRQTVLRLGAWSGFCAAGSTLLGVSLLNVRIFYFSSAFWGAYSGMIATGTEALFADSVQTGRRAFVYNLKWMSQSLCECVGSLTSLTMLLRLGNEWDLKSLQTVMYVGLLLHPIAFLALFALKDKYALEENVSTSRSAELFTIAESDDTGTNSPREDTKFMDSADGVERKAFLSAKESESQEVPVVDREVILMMLAMRSAERRARYVAAQRERHGATRAAAALAHYASHLFEWSAVPYLVCLVDFLVAVGSGMTLRYIPLFFVTDHHASPAALMGAYMAISILQALVSCLVRYLGEYYINRVAAVIIVRAFSAMLLTIMGLTDLNQFILFPIFILRNATMNSTRGVTRSVIMDCVKKESRAKWSAFESFSSFTWAGSAVIGGYIAEAKGYKFTFVITAVFHFIALFVLSPAIYGSREVENVQREQRWRERNRHENAEEMDC